MAPKENAVSAHSIVQLVVEVPHSGGGPWSGDYTVATAHAQAEADAIAKLERVLAGTGIKIVATRHVDVTIRKIPGAQ